MMKYVNVLVFNDLAYVYIYIYIHYIIYICVCVFLLQKITC